jgi:hypothetical protein
MFAITGQMIGADQARLWTNSAAVFVHGNLILIHEQLMTTTRDELFLLLEIT